MVEDPIKAILEYRTSKPYKNLSFAGNKSEKYSAVKESVAATYSFFFIIILIIQTYKTKNITITRY